MSDQDDDAVPLPAKDEMSECELDENLAASFPASDPPSWTLGTDHAEPPENKDGVKPSK